MSNINPGAFTTRPEIDGTFGVVTSTHWIGTAVGMGILERGGNAFDAGIATAFTLQVVEPHLCGPGGDVPVILYDVKRGEPEVVCGQGPAPAGASIAHYRGHLGLDIVPGTGLLPACVPGTFETYMMILRDHGTMRLRDVLEPALGYARNGHPIVERACATIATVEALFREHWPTSAATYLPGGKVPMPGTMFSNQRHADTYARILEEAEAGGGGREAEIERARRAWSQGFVAEAIDGFCRNNAVMDVSGRPHHGVLTAQDMATWLPTREQPLHLDYGSYRVLKPDSWTQGPVLLQMLALLKGFPLDQMSPTDPEFVHLWTECAKLAYADREAFYGDPKFVEVPMQTLLSEAYNAERRKLIGREASLEQRPGHIEGFDGKVIVKGARAAAAGAGEPTFARTHTGHGADERVDAQRPRHRRHRAHRHHRQGRQHVHGHAVGRLAAVLAGDPGTRLAARHARADVLAGGRPARIAGSRQTAALYPVGRHGPARRQTIHDLGHARRRSAGPVELPVLPAPRPPRQRHAAYEHAGGDRRAGLAHRAFPAVVLAAHRAPRRTGGGGTPAAGDHRRAEEARPQGRGRTRLVRGPPDRRQPGRRAPQGRRQPARHAGLRGGPVRGAALYLATTWANFGRALSTIWSEAVRQMRK